VTRTSSRPARTAALAVGAVGAAAAIWGIGIERHLYTLRRHTVAVLEPGSAPIRVLHLSDVHLAPWQRRKQAWIASLASLRPDLIINTGDNLGHPDALPGLRAAFAGFRAFASRRACDCDAFRFGGGPAVGWLFGRIGHQIAQCGD